MVPTAVENRSSVSPVAPGALTGYSRPARCRAHRRLGPVRRSCRHRSRVCAPTVGTPDDGDDPRACTRRRSRVPAHVAVLSANPPKRMESPARRCGTDGGRVPEKLPADRGDIASILPVHRQRAQQPTRPLARYSRRAQLRVSLHCPYISVGLRPAYPSGYLVPRPEQVSVELGSPAPEHGVRHDRDHPHRHPLTG